MKKVAGIRFKPAGKVYHFDSGAFVLKPGDPVIVETDQGLGFGVVVIPPAEVDETRLKRPLKTIFRLANAKDFQQKEDNLQIEKRAYQYCLGCIKQLKLSMNLFSVEALFDNSKLTFFFTSEGRVDFRQLVKKLVRKFGIRVEMRQVGIRNQAKMCGGMGRCGRELCCSTFIERFEPVSIRMAKEQSLSLNPTKISGQCGRLMCCLTYENETYQSLKKGFPPLGKFVRTEKGKGKVIRHNLICDRVVMRTPDGQEIEVQKSDIRNTES